MATESDRVKTSGDGTILIEDGGSLSYTVTVEDGNFQADNPKYTEVLVYDRLDIVGSRKGKQQVVQFSFDVDLKQFADARANTPTIVDVIEWTNTWSSGTSAGGNGYEEKLHKVTYTAAGIANNDPADHAILYSKSFLQWSWKEGDLTKITVTGRCYTRPTRTGPT